MRIVLISDTHMYHDKHPMPDGDMLIHAGDFTHRGSVENVAAFNHWLGTLPYQHKIVIAGNHDFLFQRQPSLARAILTNATYLEDSGVTVEGLNIWGSPWQPWFYDWAFNLKTKQELAAKWSMIPDDTHILVTHGPPKSIQDTTHRGESVGCEALYERVVEVKPKLHVFGHIHESRGIRRKGSTGTIFVNAASGYGGKHPPFVVDTAEFVV